MTTNSTVYRSAVTVALATAFLLLIPLLAMQFTDKVVWDLADFAVAGTLLFGAGLTFEIVARKGSNVAYRVAVGLIGTFIARFQPHGMARALFATALAQALVALIAGLGSPASGPEEILAVNGFFVALFIGSAFLFRYAARGHRHVNHLSSERSVE